MNNQKFFKTVITYEILCADEPYEFESLEQAHYDVTIGHYSGMLLDKQDVELTQNEMHEALITQGSDPSFLDDDWDDESDD
ncbi:MAG: hypothetical protein KC680_04830 [Candidatus Peregrinibacteria bacterium]|nr:hypothetical protein [Candidatus Peregrinibacteria bacterium]